MMSDGSVVVCPGCGQMIEDDLNGPHVVRMQEYRSRGSDVFGDPGSWLGEVPEHFHKRCAPPLSNRWRLPE
jgi:hypothetical protein